MQIDSVQTLLTVMRTLYPVSFTDKQMPMITERYVEALRELTPIALDAAWSALGKTWKKRTAPTPADVLEAHKGIARYSVAGMGSTEPVKSFKERLWDKDRKRLDDKNKIIAEYREPRGRLFAQAEVEGWLWRLEQQVARAAHIIAQRNELRRPGISPGIGPSSVGPMGQHDAAYYCVTTFMDVDQIDIPDSVIDGWVEEAKRPGPVTGKKPMPADRALVRAGQQSMEVNYGADPLAI